MNHPLSESVIIMQLMHLLYARKNDKKHLDHLSPAKKKEMTLT